MVPPSRRMAGAAVAMTESSRYSSRRGSVAFGLTAALGGLLVWLGGDHNA